MPSRNQILSMLAMAAVVVCAPQFAPAAKAASAFHLEEATIADVHRAIRTGQITAAQLVNLYFKRIEAYNGTCVKGEFDPATGLMFGEIAPVENAGQVNAYMTLNIRGKRSKTDRADNDPRRARNRAGAGRLLCPHRKFRRAPARHPNRSEGQLRHFRYAHHRGRRRRLCRRQAAEGRHHGGKASLPARSSSARPTSTNMPRPASAAAHSAARPATPMTPSGSPAARRRYRGGGCRKPRDLRARHRYRRLGTLSFIARRAGRLGGDAGARQPRRYRPSVVLARPRRPDVPYRRGYGGRARSPHRR